MLKLKWKKSTIACLSLMLAVAVMAFGPSSRIFGRGRVDRSEPLSFSYRWPVGTRYTYALDWRSHQQGVLPLGKTDASSKPSLNGMIDLQAHLVLRSVEQTADGFIVGASIAEFSRHQLEVLGQALLPDAQTVHNVFDGQEALLEFGHRGEVRAMRFNPEAPEVFKNAVQWLLTEAQLVLPQGGTLAAERTWVAVEPSIQGRARVQYTIRGNHPLTVTRKRLSYDSLNALGSDSQPHDLNSEANFELDPLGHLRSFKQTETLSVRTKSGALLLDSVSALSLVLKSVDTFVPPADVSLVKRTEVRRPGEIVVGAAAEHNLLGQRTDGMTVNQIMDDILHHGNTGRMPEHSRWLWRATGLLMLEPERCRELATIFGNSDLGSRARELILDLLASAGTPQAQDVMRKLLDSPAAHQSIREHTLLLQRISLLNQPSSETLNYVAQQYAKAEDGPEQFAAAYTLGATLGHMKENGESVSTESHHGRLIDGLNKAKTPEAESIHLRALGNAGLDEDVAVVLSHSRSEAPEVRQSVAAALRKTATPDATRGLLVLVGDEHSAVQAEALSSLEKHALNAEGLAKLNQLVQSSRIDVVSLPLLVELLAKQEDRRIIPGEMLTALARQGQGDPALVTRIRQLLGRLGG